MNENTEQDVVRPLHPNDVDVVAMRESARQSFNQFTRELDAKAEPEPLPEPVATPIPSETLEELNRLRADNERLKVIEREVDLGSDPDFQKTYTQPMVKTYHSTLQEIGEYLDASPEKIQKELFDPAGNWTPAMIEHQEPEWIEKQLSAMVKAPSVVRAKVRAKWEEAVRLDKARLLADAEWRKPENAESRRQYRQQEQDKRTTTDLVAREIAKALEEPEFAYFGNLTKRAEQDHDPAAQAEVAELNRDFPGGIALNLRGGEPPGTAVRNALRRLTKKGGVTQTNKVPEMSSTQGSSGRKPLPTDGVKSLRDSFSRNWDTKGKPPIRYNSLTSKYE